MPVCGKNYSGLSNYVIVANAAALPSGPTLRQGMMAFQIDFQLLLVWNGLAWRAVRSEITNTEGSYGVTTSGTTALTVNTFGFGPAQSPAYTLGVWASVNYQQSVATDTFETILSVAGVE